MFEPSTQPRIFGEPPGVDFAQSLVSGLEERLKDATPTDWASCEIYVSTSRMQRRIREIFDAGGPRLLPRIRLITELPSDLAATDRSEDLPPLRRKLELSQFIAKLLEQDKTIAPRSAIYELSESLSNLMREMHGEGVTPDRIMGLDVTDQSGHWERTLRFLQIITPYFGQQSGDMDKEARLRADVTALAERWNAVPPRHPVIVAGSTGSRGTTADFMKLVATLPQGAVILPGFDFDLPQDIWDCLSDATTAEDHPQFRFRRLMEQVGFAKDDVQKWSWHEPVQPDRNKLISLALRPAPVTSQWLSEGPKLEGLAAATADITLVEAPSTKLEAETIALRLRLAAEQGITAALISSDRMLTRQVTASLDRWGLVPDDSAGIPLTLSPPGRLLRHCADLFCRPLTAETLLIVLKHPLVHSGGMDRGRHLLFTRELELHLRRYGPPYPTAHTILAWAEKDEDRLQWARWLANAMPTGPDHTDRPIAHHIRRLIEIAEALCAGPDGEDAGELWNAAAGRSARAACDQILLHADSGGQISATDFANLLGSVLSEGEVRDRDTGDPRILIWGTLEARVQGADLVILGSLNDGIWPETPQPDPWLNRTMRREAGLLSPERRIGLSAHDFQQAVAGKQVWITRSKRTSDAESVPSRWVNRLSNLLRGLPGNGGVDAHLAMQARGDEWIRRAEELSEVYQTADPAPRPSPCPPVQARPSKLSVTEIKTLIRDPYAIYARHVLRLNPLNPLSPTADAPLRGIIIHKILERFIAGDHAATDRDAFIRLSERLFAEMCPWPTIRAQWQAKLEQIADPFLLKEAERQALAEVSKTEVYGEISLPSVEMTLTCKADRIDLANDGQAIIYDYKSGAVPTKPQQLYFEKQLLLESAMVEKGAFQTVGAKAVRGAYFLGVNAEMKTVPAPISEVTADQVWAELVELFENWRVPDRGYTARLALFLKKDASLYDHLSRFGEWSTSDSPTPVLLS